MNETPVQTEMKKPAPKPATPSDVPRGIPVASMRFVSKSMQVPGRANVDEGLRAEKIANGREWKIEYLEAMRHHKISFFDPGRTKDVEVAYVHEVHVASWKPLPL